MFKFTILFAASIGLTACNFSGFSGGFNSLNLSSSLEKSSRCKGAKCGGGATPTPTATPTATPNPTATPTATPIATATPTTGNPTPFPVVGQYPIIPSNFNINDYIETREAADIGDPIEGAFRIICNPSHLAYDDPIVYPGKKGASHLHMFFGNTQADANSTYESLRGSGESTCGNRLNRSAYWVPAMMNGKGQVVRQNVIVLYYKRSAVTHPHCLTMGKGCVDLPRGLRMVTGRSMTGGTAMIGDNPLFTSYFNCDGGKNPAPGVVSGHYSSLIEAAKNCRMGGTGYDIPALGMIVSFANCWDGIHLDSTDHRSHMAFASYGTWGYLKCPDTHPYVIPQVTVGSWYTVDNDLYNDVKADGTWTGTYNGWHLSSDEMNHVVPGGTAHADWFGAWDDSVMQVWTDNCINKGLSCNSANLGNLTGLKAYNFSWTANPRLVDPPPMPAMDMSTMNH